MRNLFIIFTFLSALQVASVACADDGKATIAVIVAGSQKVEALNFSADHLSLIYWRKQQFWPKGIRIKPVNLNAEHPLRLQFSQTILGSLPNAQIDYWNGQYFNGILPPYAVNSEEAVIRYVAQTKGAIGYINACNLDNRVIPLAWIQNDKIMNVAPYLSCE